MLYRLGFENYKSFKDYTELEIKPITVFVGPNSAGKSSILKLVKLLAQSVNYPNPKGGLNLDGPYTKIANQKELYSKLTKQNSFYAAILTEYIFEMFPNVCYDEHPLIAEFVFNDKITKVIQHTSTPGKLKTSKYLPALRVSEFLISDRITDNDIKKVKRKLKKKFQEKFSNELFEKLKKGLKKDFLCPSVSEIIDTVVDVELKTERNFFLHPMGLRYVFGAISHTGIKKDYKRYCKEIPDSFDISKYEVSSEIFYPKSVASLVNDIQKLIIALESASNEDEIVGISSKILKNIGYLALETFIENITQNDEIQRLINYNESLQDTFKSFINIPPLREHPHAYYDVTNLKNYLGLPEHINAEMITSPEFFNNLNYLLKLLGFTYQISIKQINPSKFADQLYYLELVDLTSNKHVKINNVGFGISQVLPILVSLLIGEKSITIIEQPELHLHPNSQFELSQLFSVIYSDYEAIGSEHPSYGRYLIETHSEHFIRGLQVQVAEKKLKAEDIAIHYVSKDETGCSHVKIMELDEKGFFKEEWPEGFMDIAYKASKKMLFGG
ncbi:MAG: hypothetical protein SCALA702_26270 [Melioribacteraceae bacterium]|nr:MAG: hypothetical protein SCALA702_26270 [Melioribacteraceae bacterium]